MSKNYNLTNKDNHKGNSNTNKFNENSEKNTISIDMDKIENCIKNIFSKEKDIFLSLI